VSDGQLYDTIGATYTVTRCTEPRIAAQVWAALGDARTVLNIGAGAGSYEPPGRDVIAVEPSAVMRAQRPADAAPCVAAAAESPGLREMRRVARRLVVFTHDTSDTGWRRRFWLTRDYLPGHTWTITYVAECRCGPESGRSASSGQCAASGQTLPQAGGPNATATSSPSTRRSLASACS
jgi:hypothetical protein